MANDIIRALGNYRNESVMRIGKLNPTQHPELSSLLFGVFVSFLPILFQYHFVAEPRSNGVEKAASATAQWLQVGSDRVLVFELRLHTPAAAHSRLQELRLVEPGTGVAVRTFRTLQLEQMTVVREKELVVYFWEPIRTSDEIPKTVKLEWIVEGKHLDGGSMSLAIEQAPPVSIAPPLHGGPWVAVYDPMIERGHRRVFYGTQKAPKLPGRFAIDFFRVDDHGRMVSGHGDNPDHWVGYGAPVLAVANATVVAVRGDRPDGRSPFGKGEDPAQGSGNYIALNLGAGRYAWYEHLKPSSIRVKVGEWVKRGQVIAELGNSGDTAGPHLHFHVSDSSDPLNAEGMPFNMYSCTQTGRYPSIGAAFSGTPWEPVPVRGCGQEFPAPNAVLYF